MANFPLKLFVFASIFVSTTIANAIDNSSSVSPGPPSFSSLLQFEALSYTSSSSSSFSPYAAILGKLGFGELAATADSLSATAAMAAWQGPTTIFAPTEASFLTCPSCSVPLLLQEHTIPGFYPLSRLRNLAFGTRIETFASRRCLTITSSYPAGGISGSKVFVGGLEITRPDLYNDGNIVVHGLQGFVSHLSPLSCEVEKITSLSFPPPPLVAEFFIMRRMLQDVMLRLRISGFSVLALALRAKYHEIMDLRSMTLFALDDASVFAAGHSYVFDLQLHIVPNRRLLGAGLENLKVGTMIRTMEWGQNLVVTTRGGGGPLAPMRINYVKIERLDLMYNQKIAVHGLSVPFKHVNQTAAMNLANFARCSWGSMGKKASGRGGICEETP
ncbi:hypothetical protein NMG60_11033356 [Bertholletia excelsa]